MSTFLRHAAVFFGILFVLLVLPGLLLRLGADFSIPGDNTMLLLGHSHPECAIDDQLVPGLFHAAQAGESYFYTYQKARLLLHNNPQIQTVLIEFTNNQIHPVMEGWIWGDVYMGNRFPLLALWMPWEDIRFLYQHNPGGLSGSIPLVFQQQVKFIAGGMKYRSKAGGFLGQNWSRVDSLAAAQPVDAPPLDSLARHNLAYLEKLVAFCREEGKQVVLIRSPQHPALEVTKYEDLYQAERRNRFADIPYLDFDHFPLPDSLYADLEHLNSAGAQVFSAWFQLQLEEGMLERGTASLPHQGEAETIQLANPQL